MSDFGAGLNGMAGMCVDIPMSFMECIGPVDPLFGLLIVAGSRNGQRGPLFVWFVCFCRITVFQIHLEDPVTVQTIRNKINNTLYNVWLLCSNSLALGVMGRLGTMEQCSGAPGGLYISWYGFCGLSGGRDPCKSAVIPGRRSLGPLCVAATSVAVGGASGPSNKNARTHRRLLREDWNPV